MTPEDMRFMCRPADADRLLKALEDLERRIAVQTPSWTVSPRPTPPPAARCRSEHFGLTRAKGKGAVYRRRRSILDPQYWKTEADAYLAVFRDHLHEQYRGDMRLVAKYCESLLNDLGIDTAQARYDIEQDDYWQRELRHLQYASARLEELALIRNARRYRRRQARAKRTRFSERLKAKKDASKPETQTT